MKQNGQLATQIRHSDLTAQTNYLKISDTETKEDKADVFNNLQNEIYNLKNTNITQINTDDRKYKTKI